MKNKSPKLVILAILFGMMSILYFSFAFVTQSWAIFDNQSEKLLEMVGKLGVPSFFQGGLGTSNDPFIIRTANQLNNMSKLNNTGIFNDEVVYFEIDSTIEYIDMSQLDSDYVSSSITGYEILSPIGSLSSPFVGHFDGNGKIIRNLILNTDEHNVGLFGYIGSTGTVQNLILEDVTLVSHDSASSVTIGGLIESVFGTPSKIVHVDQNTLTLAGTSSNQMSLASTGTNGSVITWSSSNTAVLSNAGVITRPTPFVSPILVTMRASLEYVYDNNIYRAAKEFNVTINASDATVSTPDLEISVGFIVGKNLGTISHVGVTSGKISLSGQTPRVAGNGLIGTNLGTITEIDYVYPTGINSFITDTPGYIDSGLVFDFSTQANQVLNYSIERSASNNVSLSTEGNGSINIIEGNYTLAEFVSQVSVDIASTQSSGAYQVTIESLSLIGEPHIELNNYQAGDEAGEIVLDGRFSILRSDGYLGFPLTIKSNITIAESPSNVNVGGLTLKIKNRLGGNTTPITIYNYGKINLIESTNILNDIQINNYGEINQVDATTGTKTLTLSNKVSPLNPSRIGVLNDHLEVNGNVVLQLYSTCNAEIIVNAGGILTISNTNSYRVTVHNIQVLGSGATVYLQNLVDAYVNITSLVTNTTLSTYNGSTNTTGKFLSISAFIGNFNFSTGTPLRGNAATLNLYASTSTSMALPISLTNLIIHNPMTLTINSGVTVGNLTVLSNATINNSGTITSLSKSYEGGTITNNGTITNASITASTVITNASGRTISTLFISGGGTLTNRGTITTLHGDSSVTVTNYNIIDTLNANHTSLSVSNLTSGTIGVVHTLVYNVPSFAFTNSNTVTLLIINAPLDTVIDYYVITMEINVDNVSIGETGLFATGSRIDYINVYGDNVTIVNNGSNSGTANIIQISIYGFHDTVTNTVSNFSGNEGSRINRIVIMGSSRYTYISNEYMSSLSGNAIISSITVNAGSFGNHIYSSSIASGNNDRASIYEIYNYTSGGLLLTDDGSRSVGVPTPKGTGTLARNVSTNQTLPSGLTGDVIITASNVTLTIPSGVNLTLLRVNPGLTGITINVLNGASIIQANFESSHSNISMTRYGTISELVLIQSYTDGGKFGSFTSYFNYKGNNVTLTLNSATSANYTVLSNLTGCALVVTSTGTAGNIIANSNLTVTNAGSIASITAIKNLTLTNTGSIQQVIATSTFTSTTIGTIQNLTLEGTTSFTNTGGTINRLVLNTQIAFINQGTVGRIEVNANETTITNQATRTIQQIVAYKSVTITNSGTISNPFSNGLQIGSYYPTIALTGESDGSTITNQNGGIISGANQITILLDDVLGTSINNTGTITTTSTSLNSMVILQTGSTSSLSLINYGTIGYDVGTAFALVSESSVKNTSSVHNSGTIYNGMSLTSPFFITNLGVITSSGENAAILFLSGSDGSTLSNEGTIGISSTSSVASSAIQITNAKTITINNLSSGSIFSNTESVPAIFTGAGLSYISIINEGTLQAPANGKVLSEDAMLRGYTLIRNSSLDDTVSGTINGNLEYLSFDAYSSFNNSDAGSIFHGSLTISSSYFNFYHNNSTITGALIVNGDHTILYDLPTYDVQGGLYLESGINSLPIFLLESSRMTGSDNILTVLSVNCEAIIYNNGIIIDTAVFSYQSQNTNTEEFDVIMMTNTVSGSKINHAVISTQNLMFLNNEFLGSPNTIEAITLNTPFAYFSDLGSLGYNIGTLTVSQGITSEIGVVIGENQTVGLVEANSPTTISNYGTLGNVIATSVVHINNYGLIQNTTSSNGAIYYLGNGVDGSIIYNRGTIESSILHTIYLENTLNVTIENAISGHIIGNQGSAIYTTSASNTTVGNVGEIMTLAMGSTSYATVTFSSSVNSNLINEGYLYSANASLFSLISFQGSTTTGLVLNEEDGRIGVLPNSPSTLFQNDFVRVGDVTSSINVTNKGWVYGNMNFTQATTLSKFDNGWSNAVFIGQLTIRSSDTSFEFSRGIENQNRLTTLHLYSPNSHFLNFADYAPENMIVYSSISGIPTLEFGRGLTLNSLTIYGAVTLNNYATIAQMTIQAPLTYVYNAGDITTIDVLTYSVYIYNYVQVDIVRYYGTINTVNKHGYNVTVIDPNNGVTTINS